MRKTLALAAACLAVCADTALAGTGDGARLPPLEAGGRQGQAIGAALVCPGVKVTKKAEELAQFYSGRELEVFSAQSSKIADLWRNIQDCGRAGGPDQCRIINQKSCQEALREIGPTGINLPGLIELAN